MRETWLITGGVLIPMTEPNAVIEDAAVLVDDGRIVDLGPGREVQDRLTAAQKTGAETLDARGQLILPGAICAHTHFYGAFARGMPVPGDPPRRFLDILSNLWWRLDRALDLDAVRSSALVCLADAIRHGTTTLIDHHASPEAISGSLDVIAGAVEQAGLRAALCYEVTDRNGLEGARAGIRENVDFALGRSRFDSPRVRAGFGIHASLTVSDPTLEACVQAAEGAGLPLHMHVAEDEADQEDCLRKYGMRVVHRLASRGALTEQAICAHCVRVNAEEIDILARVGAKVVHQPRSNLNNAVGFAPVREMVLAGVCVGLGNDGFSNDGFAELKVMDLVGQYATGRALGVTGYAIRSAYANNRDIARLFWPEYNGSLGALLPGAPADIILVDYRPFTPLTPDNLPWHIIFGIHGGLVTHTLCHGRLLMRDRQLLTLDEPSIYAHAREAAARTWQRVQHIASDSLSLG